MSSACHQTVCSAPHESGSSSYCLHIAYFSSLHLLSYVDHSGLFEMPGATSLIHLGLEESVPSYNRLTPSSHVTSLIHGKLKVFIVEHRHTDK